MSVARDFCAFRSVRPLLASCVWLPLLAVHPLAAAGDEPSAEPQLRLETGAHTAMINRIAADRQGRWIASASDDKTLRLWDAASGRLLRVDRPPIGEGNAGKLYAVAMDPAGDWIAAGGWDWDDSIYVFERSTGRLRQRISGLGEVIMHLCVAPDGSRLAAMLGSGEGLRVYAPNEGFREILSDQDYEERGHGCDFTADGRLVTTSQDGHVRLYRPSGSTLRRTGVYRTEAGAQPFGVAFDPSGNRIAVGFDDAPLVTVLNAETFQPVFEADTAGMSSGNLNSVAWSSDGSRLLAGGAYDDGTGKDPLVVWEGAGRGKRHEWPAASNSLMGLIPLANGRLVVASADPLLLLFDESGQMLWRVDPAIVDMRNKLRENLLLSADGRRLAFGLGYGGEEPVWFDLEARRLQSGVPEGDSASELRAAVVAADGLDIQDWEDQLEPTLNGDPLQLKDYERSRSLAIAPDGRHFLLGSEWSLRLFDRDGEEVWSQAVPATTWGVNVSADGRLAVAAFGDGTLRWYRLEDGTPLLSLFPHKNGKDWVLWTPSGYYDASPSGDRLIGWHLNNGKDLAADFMPAGQLRQRFYRPDVVAAILETLDESKALKGSGVRQQVAVEEALPPMLELLDPVEGAQFNQASVRLRYRVASRQKEPVTAIKVLVDGRPLPESRGLGRVDKGGAASGNGEQLLEVTLPTRDLELSLIAENRFGASVPASVRLTWAGQAPTKSFVIKPKLYALAIGVSAYEDPALALNFPAKDAQDVAKTLDEQSGRLYREVVVRTLPDATADQILDGLDWLRAQVTSQDVAILFLAGHGVNDADGDYYFLPRDVDPERLRRTAVPYYEIKKTLSSLAGKTLAFIDTCHAGNVMGARRGGPDITAVVNDLTAAENGVVVFASSTGRQYALEDSAWGNGAFTKALVEGLEGKANYTGDGRITINQLDLYLSERVKELTGNRQTPSTTKPETVVDYPIAVVK